MSEHEHQSSSLAPEAMTHGQYAELYEAVEGERMVAQEKNPHGEAPKLQDLRDQTGLRTNRLTVSDQRGGMKHSRDSSEKRTYTEGEMIQRLIAYLDHADEVTQQFDDKDATAVQQEIKELKENLYFLGESEVDRALEGIAQHWRALIEEGFELHIVADKTRSERYMSLKALSKFDEATAGDTVTQASIHYHETLPRKAIERSKSDDSVRFILLDDVTVSGSEMDKKVSSLAQMLTLGEQLTQQEAEKMIEVNLVARSLREGEKFEAFEYRTSHDYYGDQGSVAAYAYYEVPSVDGRKSPITFSHSSTDYGFETDMRKITSYLREKGSYQALDLPIAIERPYEYEMPQGESSFTYVDEELESRRQRIKQKYEDSV